jgi:GAF domain-containing protein
MVNKVRKNLIKKTQNILKSNSSRDKKLQDICDLLKKHVEIFDWVGFYLVDPQADRELILGPFAGEETEHKRIPFGKGICGQSAETEETFVVQDVAEADNYLACDVATQAEIVVPVMENGKFVAELDIDSHTKNSISVEYRNMLEEICDRIAIIF